MKTCLLAITGSIAALKTPEIVRELKKNGFDVYCSVTRAGREFVAPGALAAISGNPVLKNEYFTQKLLPGILADSGFLHLDFAKKIDLLLIAPATADSIARLTYGRANGLFETIALSTKAPILIAPAMNTEMLESKIVQENIDILKNRGMIFLPTERGELACGSVGEGRLLPAEEIMFFAKRAVTKDTLKGKKILITLGATEEPIDPVRVLTNRSSGKMGIALAKEIFFRSGEVDIISGKTKENIPHIFTSYVYAQTAEEMLIATKKKIHQCDMAFFVAAVSDFTPAKYSKEKISSKSPLFKKQKGISEGLLEFKKTLDIAAHFGKEKKPNQKFYGFALQTDDKKTAEEKAREKMKTKNLNGMFLNFPDNLETNTAKGIFLMEGSSQKMSGTKEEVARMIIENI